MPNPIQSGETDLALLLRSLRPVARPEPYVFCVAPELDPRLVAAAFAIVREDEGVTYILPQALASHYGYLIEPVWACITLMIHSSLAAVGMIAAISTRLAGAGISTNPIAGYYHDHVFVQWDARDQAIALIEQGW
jgi:hypothetical protein